MSSGDAGVPAGKCYFSRSERMASLTSGRCDFNNVDTFRAFCALGDIDPDSGRIWSPYEFVRTLEGASIHEKIWISRTKDIVIETSNNPLEEDGYCQHFGLTGVADKAIAMWEFMHYKFEEQYGGMPTIWVTMLWSRDWYED